MKLRIIETIAEEIMLTIEREHAGEGIFQECIDVLAEIVQVIPENRIITIECDTEIGEIITKYHNRIMDEE